MLNSRIQQPISVEAKAVTEETGAVISCSSIGLYNIPGGLNGLEPVLYLGIIREMTDPHDIIQFLLTSSSLSRVTSHEDFALALLPAASRVVLLTEAPEFLLCDEFYEYYLRRFTRFSPDILSLLSDMLSGVVSDPGLVSVLLRHNILATLRCLLVEDETDPQLSPDPISLYCIRIIAQVVQHSSVGNPLVRAVHHGNDQLMRLLLSKKADVNAEDDDGSTPLLIAVDQKYFDLVEPLLQRGADVHKFRSKAPSHSPLSLALVEGYVDVIRLFLQHKTFEINQRLFASAGRGKTPVQIAAYWGHSELVELLIQHGADISLAADDLLTPLLYAAEFGHKAVVDVLLSHKAAVDQCDDLNRSPLSLACVFNQEEVAKTLLEHGADINHTDKLGRTPLFLASSRGHLSVVELLCKRGADVNKGDARGRTPLRAACFIDNRSVAETLISYGADVNGTDKDGNTPLLVASMLGHKSIVEMLIRHGGNVGLGNMEGERPVGAAEEYDHESIVELLKAHGADGYTLLHWRSECGDVEGVETLLREGGDVNQVNMHGETALYLACKNGHLSVVEMLIDHGANVDQCDKKGTPPLFIAYEKNHLSIVEMLVNHGANVNQKKHKKTLLFHATQDGNSSVVKTLLEHGAEMSLSLSNGMQEIHIAAVCGDVDAITRALSSSSSDPEGPRKEFRDSHGNDILHYAVKGCQRRIVEVLLHQGVCIESSNDEGYTPLMVASLVGSGEIVALLLQAGANLDQKNNAGETALYLACKNGHLSVVEMLIDHGANVDQCDKKGTPPLFIAYEKNHLSIVEMLVNHGANVNQKKHKKTLLFHATQDGNSSVVKTLLEHGASISRSLSNGMQEIHIAAVRGDVDKIARGLKKLSSDSCRDYDGNDILHYAVKGRQRQIVELLIKSGWDINTSDDILSVTPLHIAAVYGYDDMIELLLHYGADVSQMDEEGYTAFDRLETLHNRSILSFAKSHPTSESIPNSTSDTV